MSLRVSVICTVLNEEQSVDGLLQSLAGQTRRADEVVIVDGGSKDHTVEVMKRHAAAGLPLRIIACPGSNIAMGRNRAIQEAGSEIIASTDAGVRLSAQWLESLVEPLERDASIDVVSGFFEPDVFTTFELAMGATVLPSLQEISLETFLPSSRSVAFRKACWSAVGGYPEWLDYCEDLVFDLALRCSGANFVFVPEAVARFRPRGSFATFFWQYYRYARGDGKAGLWPRRHAIRYVAYAAGAVVLLAGFWYKLGWLVVLLAGGGYLRRPYRRLMPCLGPLKWTDRCQAVLLVPMIRLVGDCAKMVGYPVGLVWRWRKGSGAARP